MNTTEMVAVLQLKLLERVTAARYDLWFKDKTKFTLDGDRLTVGVSNLLTQDWLQNKFADDVRAAAFGERRVGLVAAGREPVDHLAEKPRATTGAAPDHHAIGTGLVQGNANLIKCRDITVT